MSKRLLTLAAVILGGIALGHRAGRPHGRRRQRGPRLRRRRLRTRPPIRWTRARSPRTPPIRRTRARSPRSRRTRARTFPPRPLPSIPTRTTQGSMTRPPAASTRLISAAPWMRPTPRRRRIRERTPEPIPARIPERIPAPISGTPPATTPDPDAGLDDTPVGGLDETDLGEPVDETDVPPVENPGTNPPTNPGTAPGARSARWGPRPGYRNTQRQRTQRAGAQASASSIASASSPTSASSSASAGWLTSETRPPFWPTSAGSPIGASTPPHGPPAAVTKMVRLKNHLPSLGVLALAVAIAAVGHSVSPRRQRVR